MKKLLSLILAVSLLLGCASALADSAVDTIMGVGTTQAFTDEAVSADDLKTILQAGLAAESAINQQPWFFVAITSKELMDELGGSGAMPGGKPEGAAPEGFEMPEGAEKPEGAGDMPAMPAGGGAKASLGSSPAAIILYKNNASMSPDASFDCGLAMQNMVIAAAALGYGVKIVSSPTMTLNGGDHDTLCEKLGVDPTLEAVAVLLIGYPETAEDAVSSASTRSALEEKTVIIE